MINEKRISLKQLALMLVLSYVIVHLVNHWDEPLTILSGGSAVAAEPESVVTVSNARLSIEECIRVATTVTISELGNSGKLNPPQQRIEFWDKNGRLIEAFRRGTIGFPSLSSRFMPNTGTPMRGVKEYVLRRRM